MEENIVRTNTRSTSRQRIYDSSRSLGPGLKVLRDSALKAYECAVHGVSMARVLCELCCGASTREGKKQGASESSVVRPAQMSPAALVQQAIRLGV
jgi:hypothetical protein